MSIDWPITTHRSRPTVSPTRASPAHQFGLAATCAEEPPATLPRFGNRRDFRCAGWAPVFATCCWPEWVSGPRRHLSRVGELDGLPLHYSSGTTALTLPAKG